MSGVLNLLLSSGAAAAALNVEYLVVAGGAGGGATVGSAGGSKKLRAFGLNVSTGYGDGIGGAVPLLRNGPMSAICSLRATGGRLSMNIRP